jgi:hypothetical protein
MVDNQAILVRLVNRYSNGDNQVILVRLVNRYSHMMIIKQFWTVNRG